MHLFHKNISGLANSVKCNLGLHCLHMPIIRKLDVRNFRTIITVMKYCPNKSSRESKLYKIS